MLATRQNRGGRQDPPPQVATIGGSRGWLTGAEVKASSPWRAGAVAGSLVSKAHVVALTKTTHAMTQQSTPSAHAGLFAA